MIIGECPYCDEDIINTMPDGRLPVYVKIKCDSCEKYFWMKFSRIESFAMTDEYFKKHFSELKNIVIEGENLIMEDGLLIKNNE